jgi:hypothetical protein
MLHTQIQDEERRQLAKFAQKQPQETPQRTLSVQQNQPHESDLTCAIPAPIPIHSYPWPVAHPPGYTQGMAEGVETYRDPIVELYKKDVDRTLLRENLKLSVEDRFRRAMALARFADELRRAGREARARTV